MSDLAMPAQVAALRRRWWQVWAATLGVCALVSVGTVVQRCMATYLLGSPTDVAGHVATVVPHYLVWGAIIPLVWLLARRFPLAGRGAAWHAAVHVAGCAAFAALQMVAFTATDLLYAGSAAIPGAGVFGMALLSYGPYDLGLYLAVLAVYHAVRYHRAYGARAVKDANLQTRLAEAELDALRAHLQPGFLFQSLDAVAELMGRDVRGARKALADLSELLRLSLNEGGGRPVPLGEELELLERYFAVRALGGTGPRLRLAVEARERKMMVAPALLQPLADALLECPAPEAARTFLDVRARREEGVLRLEISASGTVPGPLGSERITAAAARLERFYGTAASLEWTADGTGSQVEVALPLAQVGEAW